MLHFNALQQQVTTPSCNIICHCFQKRGLRREKQCQLERRVDPSGWMPLGSVRPRKATNSQTHDVAGRDQRYRVHDQARLLVSPCMTERVPRFAKQCLECKSLALPFAQLVPILFVVRLLANIVDDACCGRLSELLESRVVGIACAVVVM